MAKKHKRPTRERVSKVIKGMYDDWNYSLEKLIKTSKATALAHDVDDELEENFDDIDCYIAGVKDVFISQEVDESEIEATQLPNHAYSGVSLFDFDDEEYWYFDVTEPNGVPHPLLLTFYQMAIRSPDVVLTEELKAEISYAAELNKKYSVKTDNGLGSLSKEQLLDLMSSFTRRKE